MKNVGSIDALRELLAGFRRAGERIALVPTMGNLHAGHVRLVERAKELADRIVASVFVNPTQFGPGEDYAAYPRTLEADTACLRAAGADVLFAPTAAAMYPAGAERTTRISVPGLSAILCGVARPGHFDGVASVCCRLFNIVQPDLALFGRKDYQQLLILKRMVTDLHLPLRIESMATVRDPDGLALSSRNQYLDESERARAPAIYRALGDCRERLLAGEQDLRGLCSSSLATLAAAGLQPDYFEIRRAADLAEPGPADTELVILAAARLGRARLIDNVLVTRL